MSEHGDIQPALSEAEWREELVSRRKSPDKHDRCEEWMEATGGTEEEYRRACIRGGAIELAHADYFTWEMVDALRQCVALADFPDNAPLAEEAIDRIAALLPPRTEADR